MDEQARRARREERRRATRRRRAAAFGSLLAVLIAVTAVAIAAGGGSSRPSTPSVTAHAGRTRTRTGTSAASPASARSAGASAASAASGPPGTAAVPILMYHVIAAPPAGAPFPGLYVPPTEFTEQMQALKNAGWHAVTMDQLAAYWRRGVALGAGKPIVLSFDNGYHSQYAQALPVLARLGWVGDENIQLTGLPPSQGGLSDAEVRGLVKAGWELDTQGISHADLIALDASGLHYQVDVARKTLQSRFHVPVNWFCYPSGHYDDTVVAAVKDAGYAGSTTVVPGWAHRGDDPYRLHRLRVLGGTSGPELLSQIAAVRADPAAPGSYSG